MSEILSRQIKNPVVINPVDHIVYKAHLDIDVWEQPYDEPVLDGKAWASSKTAAVQSDPLKITDAFIGEYADKAVEMFSEIKTAKQTRDKSLAAAIITSKDYSLLQDTVVIAENTEVIRTGVLSGLFEEVSTTTLSGKWRDFANDLKWFRNIPEGKSPEPSKGTSTETPFTVQKHGGAVAITDRARDVINGADIFARLVSQLQQKRLADENLLIAQEIESNTGNTETGVDFGARTGTPALSTTNPIPVITEIINDFESAATPGAWDLFITKGFVFNEYITNDIVRGTAGLPIIAQNAVNEQISTVPGFPQNVRWVRDNMISSSTAGWALDSSAIKKFRGPTIQYTVTDPEKEYQKYTTKTHLAVETVKPDLVFLVTGIAA